jgi:hypothetical protein
MRAKYHDGRQPIDVLTERGHTQHGLVGLSAGLVRGQGLKVATEPPQEYEDHLWIVGLKPGGVRTALATAASWIVEPPVSAQ